MNEQRAPAQEIREATMNDLDNLAKLHFEAWRDTYTELAKGVDIYIPSFELRRQQWKEFFDRADSEAFCLLLTTENGEVVGFAMGRPSDNPPFDAELNKLYIHRDHQGRGYGPQLITEVARRFLQQGRKSMWVYADGRNEPACKFFERLGGRKLGDDPGLGNYGWDDIGPLAHSRQAS